MPRLGGGRVKTSRHFVLTLGSPFDALNAFADSPFDRLVVASFEMSEGIITDSAPVAPKSPVFVAKQQTCAAGALFIRTDKQDATFRLRMMQA